MAVSIRLNRLGRPACASSLELSGNAGSGFVADGTQRNADFHSAVFALPAPVRFGPVLDVEIANEVTLAFLSASDMEVQTQHYAFLVSGAEFDQIFARVKERNLPYWADPAKNHKSEINCHYGGRDVYFDDQSGAICWRSSPAPTVAAG